jgi:hypothetical protein
MPKIRKTRFIDQILLLIIFVVYFILQDSILKQVKNMQNVLWLNADEPDTVALFDNSSSSRLKATFSGKKLL